MKFILNEILYNYGKNLLIISYVLQPIVYRLYLLMRECRG